MNSNSNSIGDHVKELAWQAARSFLRTILVFTIVGFFLAGMSYYFLREHWVYAAVAAAVAFVESVSVGLIFGIKRALALILARGLASLRLGRSLVRLIFDRMLSVSDSEEFGERGGSAARALERMPLAQANALLGDAVRKLSGGDTEDENWLRRKIQSRLLAIIEKITLSRFREKDAEHGGVDLLAVKTDLEQTVDNAIIEKVRWSLRVWTILVVLGLPSAVILQTFVVWAWLNRWGFLPP